MDTLTRKEKEFDPATCNIPKVYFFQSGPYTKIGYTKGTIKSRQDALAVGNPIPLVFLYGIAIPYARSLEERLHKYFAHKRVRGEWFALDSTDLYVMDKVLDRLVSSYGNS